MTEFWLAATDRETGAEAVEAIRARRRLLDAGPPSPRPERALVGAVLALMVAGAVLRFGRLGAQSFWLDEIVTWNLVHRPLGSMLVHGIPKSESTPPLYYLLAWVWVRIVGSSEAGLRSLSALLGTATIPVAYLAARVLAGRRAALVTALLVTVSPILVWYSQEARSYALLVFLSALSLFFFARLLACYRPRDLAAWSVIAVLALCTHYFALFLLVAEAAWLWRRLPRRPLLTGLAAPALTCLALAPLVYLQRGNATGLASSNSLGFRLVQTAQWFAAGPLHSWPVWTIVVVVTLLALLLLAVSGPYRRRRGLLLLALAAAATLLPVAFALLGKDYIFFRNLIAIWLPLTIALAVGLTNKRFLPLGAAAAIVLAAAFAYADAAVWTRPSLQRDNYRLLARRLTTGPQTALVVYPAWDKTALQHYQPDLLAATGTVRVREVTFVGVASDFRAWPPPRRLNLGTPAGFHLTARYHLQHFLLQQYIAPHPIRITTKELEQIEGAHPQKRAPPAAVITGSSRT